MNIRERGQPMNIRSKDFVRERGQSYKMMFF